MADALSLQAAGSPVARKDRGAPQRTIRLAVQEMHCGNCMRKVERALLAVPGIEGARANLSERRVSIVVDGDAADAELCISALRNAGFSAALLADDDGRGREARDQDYIKRLAVAGFAAANIMLLSVSVWSGLGADMPASLAKLFHWLSAAIALPAIAYAGQPFFTSARSALASRRLNMDVPISLGVILATAMSLFQTVQGSEQVYFDAAVTLLFFLLVGRALDERMRRRAASAAENLLGLRAPTTSVLQSNGAVVRMPTADVCAGDRILVAAGERIPVDVRVLSGTTEIDQSLITGESRPQHAGPGDLIYCGTVNLSAPFEAEATAVADNTLLAEIARMMATAEQARGRYVRLADRAARFYAPAVHVLGAATFIGWLIAGHGWEPALTAAIAVLIITCPCALALAVPAVHVVATSRLFRCGVLLKAADGLERLAEIDTVVFDKTGTLTHAEPQLIENDRIEDRVLARAAAFATRSSHPYARAIARAAQLRELHIPVPDNVHEIVGAGITGIVAGHQASLGSAHHCSAEDLAAESSSIWYREQGATALKLKMAEAIRADASTVIAKLGRKGYAVELLSGDRASSVCDVAAQAGIASWRADQRPGDKLEHLANQKAAGRKVLMVGDGLNDAPALAAAHASISPANGAAISQTAADAVLQGDGLGGVYVALTIAKTARRRALENFAIAIGYNALFVPLAVVGAVTPLIAAIAMSASSIAVTANALRLARAGTEDVR